MPDGQTLSIDYDATQSTSPSRDLAVYLMTDCTDVETCVVGADASAGPTEQLTYPNTSGSTVDLVLVLDAFSTSGPDQAQLTISYY